MPVAAALMNPSFRKDELEREREVVIGEYDRNESSPLFQFSTAMGKALWSTGWSRKNPLGERAIIQSTTPEKMRAIQQRYYVPNNTAIIITWDEGNNNQYLVPLIVITPYTQVGGVSAVPYNHYSVLKGIQQMVGYPSPLLGHAADPGTAIAAIRYRDRGAVRDIRTSCPV